MPLHPLIVHFPIALLIFSAFIYIAWLITGRQSLAQMGFIAHMAGMVGSIAAFLSGDAAEEAVVHTHEIHEILELHESLGMLASYGFAALAVWAFLRRNSKVIYEKAGFVILFVGLNVMLGITAHLGGKMVYEEGAGIIPMEQTLREQLNKEQREALEKGSQPTPEYDDD